MLKRGWSKFMVAFLIQVWTFTFVTRAEATNATLSIELKQFKDFVLEFRKTYSNAEEQAKRFKIFKSNLKLIDELNADEEDHAEYGVNKFSDLTPEEFRLKMLVPPLLLNTTSISQSSRGRWTPKQHSSPKNITVRAGTAPPCFSWINKDFYPPAGDQGEKYSVLTDARNQILTRSITVNTSNGFAIATAHQGDCGSCTLYAAVGAVSIIYSKAKRGKILLSVQQMVDCYSDFTCDKGAYPDFFLNWLTTQSIMLDADYRYNAKKGPCKAVPSKGVVTIAGYSEPSNEGGDMLDSIQKSPMMAAVNSKKMQNYKRGIMSGGGCSGQIDHMVVLVGYAEEVNGNQRTPFWDVRNSWGLDWGIWGHMKLLRGVNQCQVATDVYAIIMN